MNIENFLFVLILGLFMIFMLNWIYFLDWDKLINKMVAIISKNSESHKDRQNSHKYKEHRRYWKRIFLVQPLTFFLLFSTLSFILQKILTAFFVTMIVIIIEYGMLERREKGQRELL